MKALSALEIFHAAPRAFTADERYCHDAKSEAAFNQTMPSFDKWRMTAGRVGLKV